MKLIRVWKQSMNTGRYFPVGLTPDKDQIWIKVHLPALIFALISYKDDMYKPVWAGMFFQKYPDPFLRINYANAQKQEHSFCLCHKIDL